MPGSVDCHFRLSNDQERESVCTQNSGQDGTAVHPSILEHHLLDNEFKSRPHEKLTDRV